MRLRRLVVTSRPIRPKHQASDAGPDPPRTALLFKRLPRNKSRDQCHCPECGTDLHSAHRVYVERFGATVGLRFVR